MDGIQEARQLADAASKVLRVKNSETSLAFHTWFGKSNASPRVINTLLERHYMTAYTHLPFPTILIRISFGENTQYAVPRDKPEPGLNSLLYVCPSQGKPLNDHCNASDGGQPVAHIVITRNADRQRVGPTILIACPAFFDKKRLTNAQMVKSYRKNVDKGRHSKGFALLHEIQHMPKATSPGPPADDVADPRDSSEGCYSARCCTILPDDLKIRNAQNFAFFALDAVAFPKRAKPGSAPSS
ncbi:hypothetical protein LZ31DRAFT_621113 [Colletotrichum somersetense]|nr:hypothetical protein LZ31DRAFT_621113 [Colletotrichum somersetense]